MSITHVKKKRIRNKVLETSEENCGRTFPEKVRMLKLQKKAITLTIIAETSYHTDNNWFRKF